MGAQAETSRQTGKTMVLTGEQARELLDSIDISTLVGLRDRALIAVMTFAFARIGVVVAMRVEDYFPKGKRWWVRLHEKGGKRHEMPAWGWLEGQALLVRAPGFGVHQIRTLSRRARKLASEPNPQRAISAHRLAKDTLHPAIREDVCRCTIEANTIGSTGASRGDKGGSV